MPKPSRTKSRLGLTLVPAILTAILLLIRALTPSTEARRAWKVATVATIEAVDGDTIRGEIETLRKTTPSDPGARWISPKILLMADGSHIVYANICTKQDPRVRDLFVGKGSDGRWYFSTRHFCSHMCALMLDRRPATLHDFATTYDAVTLPPDSDEAIVTPLTPHPPL